MKKKGSRYQRSTPAAPPPPPPTASSPDARARHNIPAIPAYRAAAAGDVAAVPPPPPSWAVAGARHMPDDKTASRAACLCGSAACREISSRFQRIRDIRGRLFILPPRPEHGGPSGVAEKQRRKELKDFKMERILHHLDLPADGAGAVAQARQPDGPRGYAPRPTKKPPRRHIAYHHFHPQLLQALVVERGKTTIDFIEAQTISGLGLWNHGYGEDDRFTGVISRAGTKRKGRVDGFVPVPTYRHARRDCARVSARVRVDALIPKCRAAAAAASPASGESARGKAKNAASAELDDRDVGDLQRAVCLMADESEWLRQQVVEMEAQIKAMREALGATAAPEAAGEENEAREAAAPPVKRRRSDGRRLCDAEGCASLAVRRGVCQAHGGAPKPCRVEGCRNQAKNHGVCIRHGARRTYCAVLGCGNFRVRRGVCVRHGGGPTRRPAAAASAATSPATPVACLPVAGGREEDVEEEARGDGAERGLHGDSATYCYPPELSLTQER